MREKNTRPLMAQETGQELETAAFGRAVISFNECITNSGDSQGSKLWELLPAGETLAVCAGDLATLAGYRNTRSLRFEVDRLRVQGVPVLASDNGYYKPSDGPAGIAEIKRFLRRQDARMASNRRTTSLIRKQLRALENAPLDGQTDLWQGGGGDVKQ